MYDYRDMYGMPTPYAQQDLGALIAKAQQLQAQNPYMPQLQPNAAMNNRGDYMRITDYKEVETAPARTDGIASLYFDFSNNLFYSKKLVNGKPSIQTFSFSVVNAVGDQPQTVAPTEHVAENEQNNSEPKPDKLNIILDYIEKLDKKVNGVVKEVNKIKKTKAVNTNEV